MKVHRMVLVLAKSIAALPVNQPPKKTPPSHIEVRPRFPWDIGGLSVSHGHAPPN